jgi:cold shock CspA family protein
MGSRYCHVFQRPKGLRLHRADNGGPDVFVHISAFERAGMRSLIEVRDQAMTKLILNGPSRPWDWGS